MDKQMLKCDICGGVLKMRANHEAVCEFCGIAYSIESLREKFNGLKVSITGSRDDVAQWKELVNTYITRHDFLSAEGIVKKILEAAPSDEFANKMYTLLQEWKCLEIVNGVLIKYRGKADSIALPDGIKTIGKAAFRESPIHSIDLPATIERIEDVAFESCAFLSTIDLSYVHYLGFGCFRYCHSLSRVTLSQEIALIPDDVFKGTALIEIVIPSKVKRVRARAFESCSSLKKVSFPYNLESIDSDAFIYCINLTSVSIPPRVKTIGHDAFGFCSKLTEIEISPELLSDLFCQYTRKPEPDCPRYNPVYNVPWWERYIEKKPREDRRRLNYCQYCGGSFRGLFTKVCSECGKTKDY